MTANAQSEQQTQVGEAVDLGLSVMWANCNIGAEKPEDFGLYFAWGETQGYTGDKNDGRKFDWVGYKWSNTTTNARAEISKYFGGKKNPHVVLNIEDDAAHVNWGGDWRMPTDDEWKELIDKCKCVPTKVEGVRGMQVTGPNGNSIFIPKTGNRAESYVRDVNSQGLYWSKSHSPYQTTVAIAYWVILHDILQKPTDRYVGCTVRPVCPTK